MLSSALLVVIIISSLLGLSTRARAACLACPNCLLDPLPNNQGNACLNYWTCADGTVTCYYPSVQYPGTFTACPFTIGTSSSVSPHVVYDNYRDAELGSKALELTEGSADVCASTGIGDNSKCLPSNNPWNLATGACTAAEAYVGEPNSALL
ncbi:hypothetical protein J3R83DRAFT_5137 [Lanmaoa asiatica]|nr:hypothetical protein J3R83DRAFT_5137 [Lanmaoa asiatica]